MRARFMEEAICQKEARLLSTGALAVESGRHTERAFNSRYIVRDERTQTSIHWSDFNKPIDSERAADFLREIQTHLVSNRAFEVRGWAGALPIEFQTTSAWHAAFCESYLRHHFVQSVMAQASEAEDVFGTLRIWHDPQTRPGQFELPSTDDAFILIDPTGLNIAIVGTALASEIVEALSFLLTEVLMAARLLPLRASATCRENGQGTTLLIGAPDTDRLALALSSERFLIADDQVVWSDHGISNLVGGCYARIESLSPDHNPDVHDQINSFGTILENASIVERTRLPDFTPSSQSRCARVAFDINELPRVYLQSREADAPETIVLLIDDPTGALPLASKLDPWQLRYHYLMGLLPPIETRDTRLRASLGTTYFVDSFPRDAASIAHLLGSKADSVNANLWMLNTGVCDRSAKGRTGDVLRLIESGQLDHGPFERHPVFGFEVPVGAGHVGRFAIQEGLEVEDLIRRYQLNQNRFTDPVATEIFERGGLKAAELVSVSHGRATYPS